jgi:hypothetical protein
MVGLGSLAGCQLTLDFDAVADPELTSCSVGRPEFEAESGDAVGDGASWCYALRAASGCIDLVEIDVPAGTHRIAAAYAMSAAAPSLQPAGMAWDGEALLAGAQGDDAGWFGFAPDDRDVTLYGGDVGAGAVTWTGQAFLSPTEPPAVGVFATADALAAGESAGERQLPGVVRLWADVDHVWGGWFDTDALTTWDAADVEGQTLTLEGGARRINGLSVVDGVLYVLSASAAGDALESFDPSTGVLLDSVLLDTGTDGPAGGLVCGETRIVPH